ncbi:MAG: hypothetical protein AAGI52_13540 [Bacteroidota bacterium]
MSLLHRALCLALLIVALPAAAQGFIENRGQWNPEVLYLAQTPEHAVWITHDGFVADLRTYEAPSVREVAEASAATVHRRGHVVRVRAEGAHLGTAVETVGVLPGQRHYFVGEEPVTGVRAVREVRIADEAGGAVRYSLTARGLRATVEGERALTVEGAEVVGGASGSVEVLGREGRQRLAEVVFEGPDGLREAGVLGDRLVPGRPWVESSEPARQTSDEPVLWSTFLGDTGSDFADELKVDAEGRAVVAGFTSSVEFPTTPGAYDETYNFQSDAFVARFTADGSALDYATVIGGVDIDIGYGLGTNAVGQVVVVGETLSPDFPRTAGVEASEESTVFVARLSADGSALDYSHLIGGANQDQPLAALLGDNGRAYVAGTTSSADFPITERAYDPTFGGGTDAFVLSLNEGTVFFSTFLGGFNVDRADALAFDADGRLVIGGITRSLDFPVTNGAYDPSPPNGFSDAYVAILSSDGTSLDAATFLGGSNPEVVWSVASGPDGRVAVGGGTVSGDFPTTLDADDRSYNLGSGDGFVSVLSEDLSSLLYSTYLGGSDVDEVRGVAFDPAGQILASGATRSADFPAAMGEFSGFDDAFVVRVAPVGFYLDGGMFLSGASVDESFGLGVSPDGRILVGGATRSDDFPTTDGAFDETFGGSSDVFVTAVTLPVLVSREGDPLVGLEVASLFPNPSRESTHLALALPEAGWVAVDIVDALGRRVASVPEGPQAAGEHEVALRLGKLAPGAYSVRARVRLASGRETTVTRRLIVAR